MVGAIYEDECFLAEVCSDQSGGPKRIQKFQAKKK